jgi:hypothetical protein
MAPITPYTSALGGRDPLQAIRESARTIEALTRDWTPHDFERRYSPGKWTARQVLIHLAQTELALGSRARMALTTPEYAAHSFDQDAWMARETTTSGKDATQALLAVMRLNLALFAALSDDDRQVPFSHPEYGALTVDWIIHQMAGHHIHHLRQLQQL